MPDVDAQGQRTPDPDHIVVVGGGRWARVLLDVVCGLVPDAVAITAVSSHGAESMYDWARARSLADRVEVRKAWPASIGRVPAAIVANGTRDHVRAAEQALRASVPTIVEKPLALTAADARRLATVADDTGTSLSAAHVLRFTRYLPHFAAAVRKAGSLEHVNIEWADPAVERRYGEAKRPQAGIPVYADVLPHVTSILTVMGLPVPRIAGRVQVDRGGAEVVLDCMAGATACTVKMERAAAERRRLVQVRAGGQSVELDFTIEPGVIRTDASSVSGDLEWETGTRPLATMLRAFFGLAAGGERDARLDIDLALDTCELTDAVRVSYNSLHTES